MEFIPGTLLKHIDSPSDLKKLSREQLHQVCDELRQYIIDIVSVHGGHFAASLGVVELSVALHYVYDTPYDQLVWDVGHQAYGHKILTGRRDNFATNRKYKGLSGFPKRSESQYDTFGVGHSSTSISAALGMAIAAKNRDATGISCASNARCTFCNAWFLTASPITFCYCSSTRSQPGRCITLWYLYCYTCYTNRWSAILFSIQKLENKSSRFLSHVYKCKLSTK